MDSAAVHYKNANSNQFVCMRLCLTFFAHTKSKPLIIRAIISHKSFNSGVKFYTHKEHIVHTHITFLLTINFFCIDYKMQNVCHHRITKVNIALVFGKICQSNFPAEIIRIVRAKLIVAQTRNDKFEKAGSNHHH